MVLRRLSVLMLVTSLVSPCLGMVIGDFEGQMEGWYVPGNPNVSLQYSTLGVTLNAVSLRVQTQAGGWQDAAVLDLVGQDELIAAFLENTLLTVDVTRFAADWQGDPDNGYNQVFMVINAGGSGWDVWDQQVAGDWTHDQGDQTQTLVFDIASAAAQIRVSNLWWFEIRLVVHADEAYAPGGRCYLDNIRLLSQRPKRIVWVSDTQDADGDGEQDDSGWFRMLRAEGYDLDVTLDQWQVLDSAGVNELNAADLVIVSRAASSDSYATNTSEVVRWNGLHTPLIQMNAHMLRPDRWKWISSAGQVNAPAPRMRVDAVDHLVFSDLNLNLTGPVEVLDGAVGGAPSDTSFPSAAMVGNGAVLASTASGHAWMAEWNSDVEFYEGAGQLTGAHRMMFMAGTQDVTGVTPRGAMNLTETGQQVFLDAVAYMLQFKVSDPGPENLVHAYGFDNGTANDSVGLAHGSLAGGAHIRDGALVLDGPGDWMEMPGHVIGLNAFEGLTLECSYTPGAGMNPGWTMLAYFGDSARVSRDFIYMTSARADDRSGTAISVGDTASPWEAAFGVQGPEYDDGELHHMAVTVSETHIALYIDGDLLGRMRLASPHSIAGISDNVACLGKSGDRSDPEWIGRVHEFNIYDRALDPGEIAFLSGQ